MAELLNRAVVLPLQEAPERVLVPAAVYGKTAGSVRIESDRVSHLAVLAQTRSGWVGVHAPAATCFGYDADLRALVVEADGPSEVLHGPPGSHGYDAILRQI